MRIGVDASRTTRRERTGTENYSLQVTRKLLAIDQENQYTLYFSESPQPDLLPQVPCRHDRVLRSRRLWTQVRLSTEMALHPPDLLFVPAHVLPVVRPRSSVVTVHDLGYLYEPQAHRPLDRLYLDLSARFHARVATRILAISQATKDGLVRHYGIPPERITVTYLAADDGLARVVDSSAIEQSKSRYGIRGDYFLYVGTLQPRKNLARLIEAYSALNAKLASASGSSALSMGPRETTCPALVLAGKPGWRWEEVAAAVRRLGLDSRVSLPGYVRSSDLPALYSGAAALVFPSLYEGFGMPVLEAMICGTPVICSDSSSLPEVVGDAGLLVDPTDIGALAAALERLVLDSALRERLSRLGLERSRLFSWQRCAEETLNAFTQAQDVGPLRKPRPS